MSVAWKVHYAKLRRWTVPLLAITILAVIVVLFPHVGRVAGGARRWLPLGGLFNFQPAELAKLGMILYLSNFLANRGARVREFGAGLMPPLIVFLILAVAILRQPDLGSVLILAMITGVMLFIGGARMLEMYPVSPLLRNQASSIGITSYDGRVFYGLNADRDAMADIGVLAVGVPLEDAEEAHAVF